MRKQVFHPSRPNQMREREREREREIREKVRERERERERERGERGVMTSNLYVYGTSGNIGFLLCSTGVHYIHYF